MHTARKTMKHKCLVCGAAPGKECITVSIRNNESDPMDDPETQLAWCEFAFMAALHNLRNIKPDHYMVVLCEAALSDVVDRGNPDQGELDLSGPAFLRNQAE